LGEEDGLHTSNVLPEILKQIRCTSSRPNISGSHIACVTVSLSLPEGLKGGGNSSLTASRRVQQTGSTMLCGHHQISPQ